MKDAETKLRVRMALQMLRSPATVQEISDQSGASVEEVKKELRKLWLADFVEEHRDEWFLVADGPELFNITE